MSLEAEGPNAEQIAYWNEQSGPKWVRSPGSLSKLRRQIKQLTVEGEAGKYWYERSLDEIWNVANGDPVEVEKIAQLLALYSPQADVWNNTMSAIKAYNQWKNGVPRVLSGEV